MNIRKLWTNSGSGLNLQNFFVLLKIAAGQ